MTEPRPRTIRGRLVLSGALLTAVVLGGVYVALGPTVTVVDRLGYEVIPDQWSQPFWGHVMLLGSLPVAAAGAVAAAGWTWRRDRRRAVTCVVAPLAAVVLCEAVLKPLVGRRLGGSYSYPSGHVTAASAMLAALALAAPRRWRWVAVVLAAGGAALVSVAVVASRAHYPSDALAALLLVAGVTILVDTVIRPGLPPLRQTAIHGGSSRRVVERRVPDLQQDGKAIDVPDQVRGPASFESLQTGADALRQGMDRSDGDDVGVAASLQRGAPGVEAHDGTAQGRGLSHGPGRRIVEAGEEQGVGRAEGLEHLGPG